MTEVWKVVPLCKRYEVSNMGAVRSWNLYGSHDSRRADVPRLMKLRREVNGYLYVNLQRKKKIIRRPVHQLVLLAFVGKRPSKRHVSRHLNGVRSDNRLKNLCWGTYEENFADCLLHGTRPRGEKNGHAKLTNEQVLEIKASDKRGCELAREYQVAQTTICAIKKGRKWQWL